MKSEVNCLKYFCYIFVKDDGFGENGYRLIGRDLVTFAVNGIQLCPRSVLGYTCGLWVLGSTVADLLESAMLWLISTFNSCICRSLGEVER